MATSISSKPPVVLVTGCSLGGIGYALCEAFAARGCTVYATSRRLESITSLTHPSIHCLEMDVTSDSSVKQCVEQIVHEAGRVDIAIANAGVPCFGPVLDIPIEDAKVHKRLGCSPTSTGCISTYGVPQARNFHDCSVSSNLFVPWAGLYCASKAAVGSLTEALQMEARALSPDIRVTLVMAATVRSKFSSNSKFQIPENSLFKSCAHGIKSVTEIAMGDSVMPPSQFANNLDHAALRKQGPPQKISYGSFAIHFWVLRWLPVWLAHWVLWKLYGEK
ncbi:unnamed protein product [Rhizoctonia solani]|uniref:NADPH-dependent 1-acyldihydroxyacetone phosphate reductase n=1 Tax=Rhizoctonia solani TaxID=456999 RepID=A0A8H3C670_9AGAM|nr:unnamed protein product [Rhizoctonia solani]